MCVSSDPILPTQQYDSEKVAEESACSGAEAYGLFQDEDGKLPESFPRFLGSPKAPYNKYLRCHRENTAYFGDEKIFEKIHTGLLSIRTRLSASGIFIKVKQPTPALQIWVRANPTPKLISLSQSPQAFVLLDTSPEKPDQPSSKEFPSNGDIFIKNVVGYLNKLQTLFTDSQYLSYTPDVASLPLYRPVIQCTACFVAAEADLRRLSMATPSRWSNKSVNHYSSDNWEKDSTA